MPAVSNIPIPVRLYADDLLFGAISVQGLQKAFNAVEVYFNKFQLKANIRKSKIVFKKCLKLRNRES
jgi:hypothetical protein